MVKVFNGFRFDPELYAKFKQLAAQGGLGVTGAVTFSDSVGCEAEARVLLAWLRKGGYWYVIHDAEEISMREAASTATLKG